jgi:hypothetical protein
MMKLNGEEPKVFLKEKLTLRLKSIEINDQNSWTIHEDVRNSVDLFYEVILQLQTRHFSLTEKIKIKSKRFQNHQNFC